jgi:hypothetical protein
MKHSLAVKMLAGLTLLTLLLPLFTWAREANDPEILRQKYLELIQARQAWDMTIGSKEVVVAVIDTGVNIDHEDLHGNIWTNVREVPDNGLDDDRNGYVDDVHGWDFVEDDADPSATGDDDTLMHGTAVSGIIGAMGNNGVGIAGVTWEVRIMPLRMLGADGTGSFEDGAEAVNYAVKMGADIINFSLAGTSSNESIAKAVQRAYEAGVINVAAVGNEGDDLDETPYYPACLRSEAADWVIGVTATDNDDKETDFTNYGRSCADVAAPGAEFYSLSRSAAGEQYIESWDGTSAAAPVVSGIIALLKSRYPGLSPEDVRTALKLSVDPIRETISGAGEIGVGRVNAWKALQVAGSLPTANAPRRPGRAPTPTTPEEDSAEDGAKELVGVDGLTDSYVGLGAPAGEAPNVTLHRADGVQLSTFAAYGANFRGGVNVAVENLVETLPGPEIVTGAGPTGGPHVRVFTQAGSLYREFFAYDPKSSAGVAVSTGYDGNEGVQRIITAVGAGVSNDVIVWSVDGKEIARVPATGFRANAPLAATLVDIDESYDPELVVYERAGGSRVQVFDLLLNTETQTYSAKELGSFEAFPDLGATAMTAGTVDKNGDDRDELIFANSTNGTVRHFAANGALLGTFSLGDVGAVIATADIDVDGENDVVWAPRTAGGAVRFANAKGEDQGLLVADMWRVGATLGAW